MATLDDQFKQAAQDVQKLPSKPGNDVLLKLYSLYKQATVGDVEGKRPGILDIAGRAKFDAWSKIKGTASDAAKKDYVSLVTSLRS